MNKKKFAEQVELLVTKNNELYNDNVALSRELEKKDNIIKELNAKIAEMTGDIDALNQRISDLEQNSSTEFNVIEMTDLAEIVDETQDEAEVYSNRSEPNQAKESVAEEKAIEFSIPEPIEIKVDAKIADASSVIGKAVLKCAEVCNLFTAHGGPNAKDLVNLALGRTEVFKSEILGIVSENSDFGTAEVEVKSKLSALEEYFELLKKQL